MARIKPVLDTRYKNEERKYPLCFQLSHKRKTRLIPLGIHLQKTQWVLRKDEIELKGIENANRESGRIMRKLTITKEYINHNKLDIKLMDINTLKRNIEVELSKTNGTSTEVIEKSKLNLSKEGYLGQWVKVLTGRLMATHDPGNKANAEWYQTAVNAFIRFNKGKDIRLIDIDESFLEDFKVWGTQEIEDVKKVWKPNTIGAYMRSVRAIMNQSIREKKNFIPLTHQPFRFVKLPEEIKEVNSISKADIKAIRDQSYQEDTIIWKARARFLFMFNCQGMNFTDLAKLKLSDRISDDYFGYYRAKTMRAKKRRKIIVDMTKEAKIIWDYFSHGKENDDYVFDILPSPSQKKEYEEDRLSLYNRSRISKNPAVTEKNRIRRKMKEQNSLLKQISKDIDCFKEIKTYDARYAWVNSAAEAGIDFMDIGQGLGHAHPGITTRYFEERHRVKPLQKKLNEKITA